MQIVRTVKPFLVVCAISLPFLVAPIVRGDVCNYMSVVSFGFLLRLGTKMPVTMVRFVKSVILRLHCPKIINMFHIVHTLRLFISQCWEQWGLRSLQITLIFNSLPKIKKKKTKLKLNLLAIWLFNYLYSNSCIICKHSNLIKIKDTEFTSQIFQSNDHWDGS